ncbi:DUF5694 domain-containing protein [Runella sp.]|uniref:DUF5694 domain-containing protein n=1 Tax=Runella sp. TaxID=1960881 RepID=UPI003D0B8237
MFNKQIPLLMLFIGGILSSVHAQPKTEILLVGSYHMAGTDDPLKVDSDNMLSPKRQQEINEVLDQLQKFRPTKIFVEVMPSLQAHWDSAYVLAEKGLLPTDGWAGSESFQLGTRLAQRLKLPKAVIGVHWKLSDTTNNSTFDRLYREYQQSVSRHFETIQVDENGWWTVNAESVLAYFKTTYREIASLSVKESLKILNSPEFSKKLYYANNIMIMDKNAHDFGVTGSISNIVRNLHIYTNIMRNIGPEDERVLVVYGMGHIESLRHMFEGNPQMKAVAFSEVVK